MKLDVIFRSASSITLRSAVTLICLATISPAGWQAAGWQSAGLRAAESLRVLDPDWEINLVVAEPELVTPTGCCHDDAGRLLVVECHTHFPPENYPGPKTDRIYLFDDSDGDGVVDRKRLFYEGGTATMGLAKLEDGWIAVSTRSDVTRIRDSDGDNVADQREVLLTLKTNATYPHNGLTGLALGPDGRLYVGQGENLGEPYELIAADGSKQAGGGEGGNVFRCLPNGNRLERVATGFWNPFGLYFDSSDRLWCVGNDPDAMPPCRLLQVAEGGDYGFQFRFGRAGTHPLQSWNGKFPGTMPMAAGTGEAPCAVIGRGEHLWVTSWGDNRIERYKLTQRGASWGSQTEVVVQGDASFRPVSMSVASDGSIYVTDWVDRSYPVHGKGRLWRLSRKTDAPRLTDQLPKITELEQNAFRLQHDDKVTAQERMEALNPFDPFVRQAAMTGLVQSHQLETVDRQQADSPAKRVGLLTAWRWKELSEPMAVSVDQRRDWIEWGLRDASDYVVLAAVRWATERGIKEQLPVIREVLKRPELSPELFSGIIASIAYLETGSAARGTRDPAIEKLLVEFAMNQDVSAKLRALAIQQIPSEADQPSDEQLSQALSQEHDREFSIAVIRLLSARTKASSLDQLSKIATDETLDEQTRADAVAGLARNASQHAVVLNKLSTPKNPAIVRQEAQRILKRSWLTEEKRPALNDLEAWNKLIGAGGDPDAGRRVFFRTTCVNCHVHSGRGAKTGPDLTNISGQMTSLRLIESILEPSKEIGPLYVPWSVETVDGKMLIGLKLDASGVGNNLRFQGADGLTFEVPLNDIEQQIPIEQSIMPAGLERTISLDEFRDLVAFLLRNK